MKTFAVVLLALVAVAGVNAFHEKFDDGWTARWQHSDDEKYSGKFAVENPLSEIDDAALKVTEKAKHYGIATQLPTPVDPSTEPLVLQFDVKLTNGLECGGAYLKFLTADKTFTPANLKDDTPYTVMFGPDKCGGTNKVHLILRHESPKTKQIEEKHLTAPPSVADDDLSHVYTAILNPVDNTYAILIDGEEKKAGSLFADFSPAFVPPSEIDDPEDSKPADWVDAAKIADPDATKPDDWDEDAPEYIPDEDAEKPEGWLDDEATEVTDPDAAQPEDWDEEEDGEWEPPMIANPKCQDAPGCGEWIRPTKLNPEYKGKWTAPLIDNPAYKGPWAPRKIDNPDFYNDTTPLSHIGKVGAVAVEIWTMDEGYFFDNVVVSNSVEEAAAIRESTWAPRYAVEKAAAAAEAKKAEEEAAAAEAAEAAEAAANKSSVMERVKDSVAMAIEKVFELSFLQPYSEKLDPVRDALMAQPMAIVAALSAIVALALTPVVMKAINKETAAVDVGASKKNDGPAKKPAAAASASAASAANGKKQDGEIEEEDDEDEDDAAPAAAGGVRRRGVRRD